jgi:hypothetical protein
MASDYMYLHGRLYMSDRTAGGLPDNFVEWPSTSDIELSLETSDIEHVDKSDAIASLDLSVPYMVKGTGNIIVDASISPIIAAALFGEENAIAGGSFVAANAVFPSGIAVGDIMQIPGGRKNISSLTIVDSTGSPITLTLGTHYEVVSLAAGLIRFLDVTTGSVVQPFKAAGTEAAATGIGIFQQRVVEKYALFDGINIADDDAAKIIEFYRIQVSPTNTWKIMGDGTEVTKHTIPFKLLKDRTKSSDATFGQYGRFVTT